MFKILNSEPENFSAAAKKVYLSVGSYIGRELSRAGLIREIPAYDVLIVRLKNQIDREVIGAGENLKFIISATTGLDHIDLGYAESRKVKVLSLKGEKDFLDSIPATAELTWGLLISLSRRIPFAFDSVRDGIWDRDRFRGHDLSGKRIGIVGLGRIGRKIANFASVFGMHAYAYDPYIERWNQNVKRKDSVEDLMRVSDILSINAALTEETKELIGQKELSLLPRGALVINTSRGAILNSSALLDELRKGNIAGAALDVIPEERDPSGQERSRLFEYARFNSNLIITPHIGGATYESMEMTEIFMANKFVREAMKYKKARVE